MTHEYSATGLLLIVLTTATISNSARSEGLSAGPSDKTPAEVPKNPSTTLVVTEEDTESREGRLLRELRERDQIFDNLLLRYEKQRFQEVNLQAELMREFKNRMKRPNALVNQDDQSFRERMSQIGSLPGPISVEYASFETMTVRGGVVAFERTAATEDPNLIRELNATIGIRNTGERWSNSDELLRSSVVVGDRQFIGQATGKSSLTTIDQQRMAIEFSLGFGFGRRLLTIDSVADGDSGTLIAEGKIQVWVGDESICRLEIDEDLVVRKAHIHSDVEGNQHNFETVAIGTFEQSDLPVLAESGRFHKKWLGTMRNGELKGKPKDKDIIEIQLTGLEYPVDDTEFSRLTTFVVDDQTTVRDVTRDETTQTAKKVLLEVASNPLRNKIIVINLIAVVVVVLVYFYSRRRQKLDGSGGWFT